LNGNLIEETYFANDGSIKKKKVWKYSMDGKNSEYISYSSNGEALDSALILFHDNREIKNVYQYNDKHEVIYFRETKLDEKNRIIAELSKTYEYNWETDSNDSTVHCTVYKYDEFDNIESKKDFINGKLSSSLEYEYEYDSMNNWTKRIRKEKTIGGLTARDFLKNNELKEFFQPEITERIIKYYK